MTPTGEIEGPGAELEPNSRTTFFVGDTVPDEWSISTMVESDVPIICERAMYWGNRVGGHDSIGVTSASPTWYLAEGCTNEGFETWVLVQNPNDEKATIKLTYMTPTGEIEGPDAELEPNTRTTFFVGDTVPGEWSISTMVESDVPIICERAMYWGNRVGGHDSIGFMGN